MAAKEKTIANIEVLDAIDTLKRELDQVKEDMGRQHQEKMEELEDIKDRVKYTNGKVAMLVEDKIAREAVEQYKLKHETPTTVSVSTTSWDWKAVLAIILTLASAAAAIAGVTTK